MLSRRYVQKIQINKKNGILVTIKEKISKRIKNEGLSNDTCNMPRTLFITHKPSFIKTPHSQCRVSQTQHIAPTLSHYRIPLLYHQRFLNLPPHLALHSHVNINHHHPIR